MYRIVTDSDVDKYGAMSVLVEAIERVLTEKANGTLIAPPRFRLETNLGDLVFTAGAATGLEKVTGFRVYDTFRNDAEGHEQVVCIFDGESGVLKGIVIGNRLGTLRTGAIGGVAIKAMARTDAEQIAVIGAGVQARTQLAAAVAARDIRNVRVYSRNPHNRKMFAKQMSQKFGIPVSPAVSSRECVDNADIVICATSSSMPVFDVDWLKPGAHVTTVGPKSVGGHEVPVELAALCSVIATDSVDQLRAYAPPHFLVGTPYENRVVDLADIVVGKTLARHTADDITLFCSVGLSGTEVVVGNEILRRMAKGAWPMEDWKGHPIESAGRGENPTFLAKMKSGIVVFGDTQFLPGYCLLIATPSVPSLNSLSLAARAQFLTDMSLLGDAIAAACHPTRLNYSIYGNEAPFLHAHVFPRYEWEPDEYRKHPVWTYPKSNWTHEKYAWSNREYADIRANILTQLRAMMDVAD